MQRREKWKRREKEDISKEEKEKEHLNVKNKGINMVERKFIKYIEEHVQKTKVEEKRERRK